MSEEHIRRGRNNKLRGKSVEREVAKLVGGRRNPDNGDKQFDVETETAGYEVKSRQSPTPALIRGAWEQASIAAERTGLDPYVVLAYTPGQGHPREFWLVKRLA